MEGLRKTTLEAKPSFYTETKFDQNCALILCKRLEILLAGFRGFPTYLGLKSILNSRKSIWMDSDLKETAIVQPTVRPSSDVKYNCNLAAYISELFHRCPTWQAEEENYRISAAE
jgi:hypothetical protein